MHRHIRCITSCCASWLPLSCIMTRPTTRSKRTDTLFPYTTLFRSSRINDKTLSDTLPYEREPVIKDKINTQQDLLKQIEEKPDIETNNVENNQTEIIDDFLNLEHESFIKSIIPEQTLNYKADLSEDKEIKEDAFLTESLAKIYIKQKKYYKALEIIKKLSLKYPEKNVYFADQIRFLEIIISNIKTK